MIERPGWANTECTVKTRENPYIDLMSDTRAASAHRAAYAPIRSLGPGHRERIAAHLLALEPSDRYLRFGYSAGDVQIRHYADHLDFDRDDVFGIYNRRLESLAVAHLAYASSPECDSCAEFGVSVSKHARGRGYGKRLFERAVMHARNQGVHMLFIHALTENTPMLAIAAHAGARLERDGSETEAYLFLPPANFDSVVTELLEEQLAQTDYRLKAQAQAFRHMLSTLQDVRAGVDHARDQSAP